MNEWKVIANLMKKYRKLSGKAKRFWLKYQEFDKKAHNVLNQCKYIKDKMTNNYLHYYYATHNNDNEKEK